MSSEEKIHFSMLGETDIEKILESTTKQETEQNLHPLP